MVGTEYISADPVVLDGYAYQRVGEFDTASERQAFTPRPEAAVLPENTEAVQAIVKWCNRRGVSFKASCTGYGPWNAMTREGAILLDMRRMNRILELDEKNMFIVVEPYVSFGQIQSGPGRGGSTVTSSGLVRRPLFSRVTPRWAAAASKRSAWGTAGETSWAWNG